MGLGEQATIEMLQGTLRMRSLWDAGHHTAVLVLE